jgi:hypothetical protein
VIRETSLEAYASAPHATHQERVINFLRSRGDVGASLEEMSDGTGILLQSVCGARKALERAGRVIDTGKRTRTRSGRSAIVWAVAA